MAGPALRGSRAGPSTESHHLEWQAPMDGFGALAAGKKEENLRAEGMAGIGNCEARAPVPFGMEESSNTPLSTFSSKTLTKLWVAKLAPPCVSHARKRHAMLPL